MSSRFLLDPFYGTTFPSNPSNFNVDIASETVLEEPERALVDLVSP